MTEDREQYETRQLTEVGEALYVIREINVFYAVRFSKLQSNEPVSHESVLTERTHIHISMLLYLPLNVYIQ